MKVLARSSTWNPARHSAAKNRKRLPVHWDSESIDRTSWRVTSTSNRHLHRLNFVFPKGPLYRSVDCRRWRWAEWHADNVRRGNVNSHIAARYYTSGWSISRLSFKSEEDVLRFPLDVVSNGKIDRRGKFLNRDISVFGKKVNVNIFSKWPSLSQFSMAPSQWYRLDEIKILCFTFYTFIKLYFSHWFWELNSWSTVVYYSTCHWSDFRNTFIN